MSGSVSLKRLASRVACVALLVIACGGSASAQSPTSMAESSDEYNAYVYSYSAMVYSGGIANVMSGNQTEDELAQFIDELTVSGFLYAYESLVTGDDTLWQNAADELSLARMWCNTLIVYAEDSQSSTTQRNIRTLMKYLDIAADNAQDAAPQRANFWMQGIAWPRW